MFANLSNFNPLIEKEIQRKGALEFYYYRQAMIEESAKRNEKNKSG